MRLLKILERIDDLAVVTVIHFEATHLEEILQGRDLEVLPDKNWELEVVPRKKRTWHRRSQSMP
jgi:hypothetical protein